MAGERGEIGALRRVGQAADAPWKLRLEIERVAMLPLVRLAFLRAGIAYGRRWRIYGMPILERHRLSRIALGDGLQLRCSPGSSPLRPWHPTVLSTRRAGSAIVIGEDVGMTGGVICAAGSVQIGNRVTIGANCTILDSDYHPLDPARRAALSEEGAVAPVVIEDDVFLGAHCIVLKGVRLGAACVIGAGSVVTHDVPCGALAAGNPARVIRERAWE
jgi:acetyltransferase-like isoleucine patch superfamily enzyme